MVDTVEAETRKTHGCHMISRLPMFRIKWCTEGFFSDPFFSSTTSICGYNTCQFFYGAKSKDMFRDHMKGKRVMHLTPYRTFFEASEHPHSYPPTMRSKKLEENGEQFAEHTASNKALPNLNTNIRIASKKEYKMLRGSPSL